VYDGVWENVRYELEMKMLKANRRHMWAYFSAMRYSDWETTHRFDPSLRLRAHTRLHGDECVVLFRKPFPQVLAKTGSFGGNVSVCGVYVPPRFRVSLRDCVTEEEKLAEIMSQNMNVFLKKNELGHPNEYEYDGITPVAPRDYTCKGCDATGKHFRADCDISEMPEGGRGLDKVRRPHGIPKSQLRRVRKGEHADAMLDEGGNYVIRDTPVMRKVGIAPNLDARDKTIQAVTTVVHTPRAHARVVADVPRVTAFDFERALAVMDTQAQERDTVFYRANPCKRRKRESTCTHWLRGLCVKGPLDCDFVHDAGSQYMPVCKFFYNGQCSNEDECVFRHVTRVVPVEPCPDFVHGFCPKGVTCGLGHVKRNAPHFSDWIKCGFSREDFNHALYYM
jgi:hypothetical protein